MSVVLYLIRILESIIWRIMLQLLTTLTRGRFRRAMDPFPETIRMLRVARTMLELSQEELAERAGVSRQTIVRIEAGAKGVAFDAVERVRSALEKAGAVFLPSAAGHGPGVARRKADR